MSQPSREDVESLVELFNRSDWDEMHLKTDGLEIFLSNDPSAHGPRAAAAPAAPPAAAPAVAATPAASPEPAPAPAAAEEAPVPEGMVAVRAPNLGTFYRAPKPGAPPYVEIGETVDADTEVCLIEVMKLFTPVRAGVHGVVRQIRPADGAMVEYDQTLVVIEPFE